jgi:hypothetical protein
MNRGHRLPIGNHYNTNTVMQRQRLETVQGDIPQTEQPKGESFLSGMVKFYGNILGNAKQKVQEMKNGSQKTVAVE